MDAEASSVLVLQIGGLRYALPIEVVQEVLPMLAPAVVPDWPEPLLGLIALRGELMPLMDGAGLLHAPARAVAVGLKVVVLGVGERRFAVMVDAVEGVCAPEKPPMVTGEVRVVEAGGPVVLLDAGALLASVPAVAEVPR